MPDKTRLSVCVVYSPAARTVHELSLRVDPPVTVWQTLQMSGLLQRFPELMHPDIATGVWGQRAPLNQLLRDQDRVEIYRPLRVDPKTARRERFALQGVRAAGLFSKA